MARKMTLDSAIKQAQAADKRVEEAEKILASAKKKQAECNKKVEEIKAEIDRERFDSIARIALEKFGANVTAQKFGEILETIMINEEVGEYIAHEKSRLNSENSDIK
ncbi:hypothetical protein [Ruminococcus sp.]|uniref:hypothetical protein n=1 Tax=Ruminococcus sp. TaxID=41978 RepID=UPI0025837935|nr:hypothetical protein [Ruminococcus sp.]MCR5021147.1 hypothetical protein [Ruminococcus sp.]